MPSTIDEKATRTNVAAIFARFSMTAPPLENATLTVA
jgi:hypothetical protein